MSQMTEYADEGEDDDEEEEEENDEEEEVDDDEEESGENMYEDESFRFLDMSDDQFIDEFHINQSYNASPNGYLVKTYSDKDLNHGNEAAISHSLMEYVDRVGFQDFNAMMQFEIVEKNKAAVISRFKRQLDKLDNLFSPRNVEVMKDLQRNRRFMDDFFLPKLKLFMKDFETRLATGMSPYTVQLRDGLNNRVKESRYGKIPKNGAVEWVMVKQWKIANVIYRGFHSDPSLLDTVRSNVMVFAFQVDEIARSCGEIPKLDLDTLRTSVPAAEGIPMKSEKK